MLCRAAVHCAVATAGTNCFNPSCPNSVWKDGTHIVVGMHEGGCCGAFNAQVCVLCQHPDARPRVAVQWPHRCTGSPRCSWRLLRHAFTAAKRGAATPLLTRGCGPSHTSPTAAPHWYLASVLVIGHGCAPAYVHAF